MIHAPNDYNRRNLGLQMRNTQQGRTFASPLKRQGTPTIMKPNVKTAVQLRASMTEAQAEQLQRRLSTLPFKVDYQEEQHGAVLVGVIGCSKVQEKILRDILREVGGSLAEGLEA
jgi:hypothetical protein